MPPARSLFLLFRPSEDQVGYLLLLRSIAQRYGLPMSIYHDRHTILRSPKQPTLEEQLAGQTPMSQIQRIMAELGIESIPAYSPQAKGRIERLWGTLQDRLTKELRLADITTLEAGQRLSARLHRALQRPLRQGPRRTPTAPGCRCPPTWTSPYYFAIRETRKVRADHCISFAGQLLQLLPGPTDPSLVGQTRHRPRRARRRHLPVSWQTPHRLSAGRCAHASARPAHRRGTAPPPKPPPIPSARPSNGRGSLASTDAARCAEPASLCYTVRTCAEDRGNAGERPRAPTQGQCRGGRAGGSAARGANLPASLHWPEALNPPSPGRANARDAIRPARYRALDLNVRLLGPAPRWTFSLSNSRTFSPEQ